MSEEIQLDSRIKSAGSLAKKSFAYLKKLQTLEKPLVKTGQDFIDCHIGGLLPSDVVIYSANSGVGKTKLLYDTLDLILDKKVNDNSDNFTVLDFSLEMKYLNKILRDINKQTNKKKKDILTKEFTEEEKEVVRRYYERLQDDRVFVCEESITTKDFYNMTKSFCEKNKEKDAIIITYDHVLLTKKEDKLEDPLEAHTAYINQLRKEFDNVYFFLLTQFNRTSFTNIKDKSNDMFPRASMIYGSSHFEFLASYIIGIMNPFKLGVNEFLKVNPERYDWLEEYHTEPDSKSKISFDTAGNMFYFVLKARESDRQFMDLFIRPMDLNQEELDKIKQEKEEKDTNFPTAPKFNQPENPYKDLPQADTTTAFDAPNFNDESSEPPF